MLPPSLQLRDVKVREQGLRRDQLILHLSSTNTDTSGSSTDVTTNKGDAAAAIPAWSSSSTGSFEHQQARQGDGLMWPRRDD